MPLARSLVPSVILKGLETCDGLGEGFGGQGGNTLPRFLAPCMISVKRSYVLSPFSMGRP